MDNWKDGVQCIKFLITFLFPYCQVTNPLNTTSAAVLQFTIGEYTFFLDKQLSYVFPKLSSFLELCLFEKKSELNHVSKLSKNIFELGSRTLGSL